MPIYTWADPRDLQIDGTPRLLDIAVSIRAHLRFPKTFEKMIFGMNCAPRVLLWIKTAAYHGTPRLRIVLLLYLCGYDRFIVLLLYLCGYDR